MHLNRWLFISIACGGALGCYGLFDTSGGNGNNNSNTSGLAGDLPCDVATALTPCLGCHGPTPSGGAPISLASYADLTAKASDGRTEAEHAVDRMNGTSPPPMPPAPAAPASATDIAAIQNWINAGYPQGTCGTSDPYNTPLTCTSGTYSTSNSFGQFGPYDGSELMRPGEACISCHQANGGGGIDGPPLETFMGTVYPTAHEPNNCNGASSVTYTGVKIIVTDSQGKTYSMTPNLVGNFLGSPASFAMPYTAKVTFQGRERVMSTQQTSGDCNSCHTETGANGAPGRIMLP